MIQVGERIPEMELDAYHSDDIKRVKLSDYQGKWLVILFYPADFTYICPTELKEAADLYGDFCKAGAEVVSVSTDTAFVHKSWHDTSPAIQTVMYPMLADPTGKLCRAFGTLIETESLPDRPSLAEDEGLSLRATFIVDPDGVLKSAEIHDNSIGRNVAETLRKLQASQFVRENPGAVCPVNWKPGGNILKPSVELVGKL